MSHSQKKETIAKETFMSSATGLANTLAVVATFFGAGPLYNLTIDFVAQFSRDNYGYATADITTFIWMVICGSLIFFSARMSVSTALTVGAASLAARLFF